MKMKDDLAAGMFAKLLERNSVGIERLHSRNRDLLRRPRDMSQTVG
jgi:hypothetical protein